MTSKPLTQIECFELFDYVSIEYLVAIILNKIDSIQVESMPFRAHKSFKPQIACHIFPPTKFHAISNSIPLENNTSTIDFPINLIYSNKIVWHIFQLNCSINLIDGFTPITFHCVFDSTVAMCSFTNTPIAKNVMIHFFSKSKRTHDKLYCGIIIFKLFKRWIGVGCYFAFVFALTIQEFQQIYRSCWTCSW